MPELLTLAIVLGVLAVGTVVANRVLDQHSRRTGSGSTGLAARITGWTAIGLVIAMVFSIFGSSYTQVSTKNVGIVTSFGKPVGTLSNGVHFVAPWQKVTELDGAIQTDSHAGTDRGDKSPCTNVRIAHQAVACVDNSIRWRIKAHAADTLFRDYKNFDHIRDSLVTRELGAALNTVFKNFDPLAVDAEGNSTAPNLDVLSSQATEALRSEIGDQIEVLNVIIPIVHFDDATQSRINALQAEIANTRIAKQRQQTAAAEAQANQQLAGSVSNDPNVLVSKCLDLLAQMVKDKLPIPAGFSCWPGGGTPVIANSGTTK